MSLRGAFDGGTQKRALVQLYEESARALRAEWPATAALLENLARTYEADADASDQFARERRNLNGYAANTHPLENDAIPMTDEPASSDDTASVVLATTLHRLELSDIGPSSALELEFAPRLTLITGDNSLGKTVLLDMAWWALTRTWPSAERTARPTKKQLEGKPIIRMINAGGRVASAGYDRVNNSWSRTEWPATNSPVIYAHVDDGFSVWDRLRNGPYNFSERELWNGLNDENGVLACQGILTDWHDWAKDNDEGQLRFTAMLNVLNKLSESDVDLTRGESVKMPSVQGVKPIPTVKFPYGEVPLVHLSAGWRRILGLAYLLVWTWFEHRDEAKRQGVAPSRTLVLLLDEAEAHLHPRWQRVLLPALLAAINTLEDKISVQLVVVTHSPMIIAGIEPEFDKELDRVFHLKLEKQKITLEQFQWVMFGDASSWLESPVFDLRSATSPEAEETLKAAYSFVGRNPASQRSKEYKTYEQIDRALHRSLAPSDPFWMNWRIFNHAKEASA
jgi:hypothetical protein